MKEIISIIFLFVSIALFSQKRAVKKFETNLQEIEVSTIGLDNLILENSTSEFIEIALFAENPNEQHILLNTENNVVKIAFVIEELQTEETIFRKFITKRLQRAAVVVKIPKGKKVTIFGENINIESKSYQGSLAVFIDEGILKLHEIEADTAIKLYEGSIYASLKNANIELTSKLGKIKVDNILYEKTYQNKSEKNQKKFAVTSLKANIYLTTQKTQ
ncbi:hypothetical protein [Polaribacter glomeratus]|uniref:Adhesin domain-containing protein n=1 Tax=Polaribacter glomeratus TaxID=102 RepID=A0A2S7WHB9_9FLAO|nr:hypothetical protein [Polaribacter glomeratus]PQJ77013.1 hypothetical protein BTO16_14245 [Polaribacter glomeratus]TXD67138.1 hypothetical protein ESX12_00670 [Polaribacter glomeratus]